jgi:NH3-dependent NAD+ synthetase
MAHAERIAVWMRRQLSSARVGGFIVGLSGGQDDAECKMQNAKCGLQYAAF